MTILHKTDNIATKKKPIIAQTRYRSAINEPGLAMNAELPPKPIDARQRKVSQGDRIQRNQRMLRIPSFVEFVLPPPTSSPITFFFFALSLGTSQILQNFKFSSPAPVHTTSPAGPTQLNSTRESCASRISATRSMLG